MAEFDAGGLDEVIHGKLRLGVMAYLAGVSDASFGELKDKTGATDGNLSAQMRKLEEAGYVGIKKTFVGRKPHTRASLTPAGRRAWADYLAQLEVLIQEMKS
ncbi:winged helix-turn-helix domain-containing protein [Maricaulaceae bacterium MS644]